MSAQTAKTAHAAKTVSPISVANYLLKRAEDNGDDMSSYKLKKLVFICHGWHLGLFGVPLVNEAAEARLGGPAFPKLNRAARKNGKFEVTRPIEDDGEYSFTKGQKQLLDLVYDANKTRDGLQLAWQIYKDGTPWDQVWDEGGGWKKKIPDATIRAYYLERINAERNKTR